VRLPDQNFIPCELHVKLTLPSFVLIVVEKKVRTFRLMLAKASAPRSRRPLFRAVSRISASEIDALNYLARFFSPSVEASVQ
jgi:hypothetical protein